MPRMRPCRCLRILVLPWVVMFGLWFCLPSPIISPQQRAAYIQGTLSSGRTLISVVDYTPFRKDPTRIYAGECSECESLLLRWKLVSSDNDILVQLNDRDTIYDEAKVNLTGFINNAKEWYEHTFGGPESSWSPYFSDPLKLVEVSGGSTDEEINLPWFHDADKHMFHYDMHGFTASTVVRAMVPERGTVELWEPASINEAYDRSVARTEEAKMAEHPLDLTYWEQMAEDLKNKEYRGGLLVSFKLPESATIKNVIVTELKGDLPSRTYPIRKALLFPLGPFISIFFLLISVLGNFIAPLFPFIVLSIAMYVTVRILKWLVRLSRWSMDRTSFGGEKKHVWGPTGPMDTTRHNGGFDEEKEIGLQRPQTVRLGRGWRR